jgi:hypothetical protein
MKLLVRIALAVAAALAPPAAAGQEAKTGGLDAVPAPFRAAVAADLKGGMQLVEARDVAGAGGRFVVAILAFPDEHPEHGGDKALRSYFVADGATAVKRSELYVDHFVDFGTYDDPKTAFADLNRDGKTEMIVSAANGGNCWQCSHVLLYALDAPEPRLVVSEPMSIKDLDGDGVAELLVGDTRWESYDDFSHAGAPGGTLVYRWTPEGYRFAGKAAAAFYEQELAALRADLADAAKQVTADNELSDEGYLHDAISMLLVYAYTDRLEEGRAEFRRLMGEHVASDAIRDRRKRILDDFLSGDSAAELKTPAQGAPLEPPSKE